MNYLRKFESLFGDGIPEEITSQKWNDLLIRGEDGFELKNSPIPQYLFKEIVAIGGAEDYLPTIEKGYIQMFGRLPIKKYLIVMRFGIEGDAPYYLIRFSTDVTIPEREQKGRGLVKYYVAENFEEVKNFCKKNL